MRKEIRVDLKVGRKQSGLSNEDVAHLLGVNKSRISKLENGHATPRPEEICALCLIYGRAVDSLFILTTHCLIGELRRRLTTMPEEPTAWERKHNARLDTLNGLQCRLGELSSRSG
ncbi:helix-turn-helix transcriptional regulator [Hoeflea sp. AS60]|uniref:helix-turn-helix transcriptional regulator n=1 Tax=Hoeflea sp. AS60 TaxID=3135780 RepID=UPI00316BD5BF